MFQFHPYLSRCLLLILVSASVGWGNPQATSFVKVSQASRVAPTVDWATVLLLNANEKPLADATENKIEINQTEVVLTKGRFGKAIDCAASGEISFKIPMASQPQEALTLECWMRLDGPSEEIFQRVFGRGGNYGLYAKQSTSRVTFFLRSKEWKSISTVIPLKKWIHVAGTFDGQTMRLYVNGILQAQKDNPGKVLRYGGAYHLGGERNHKSGKYGLRFHGAIDEVRLSNVARTEFMTEKAPKRSDVTSAWNPVKSSDDAFVRKLAVLRAKTPPRLDGRLDDEIWKNLPPQSFVTTRKAKTPKYPTDVRMAYDEKNLYLAIHCTEKGQETLRAGPAGHDDLKMFDADSIEIFLQPGGVNTPYYQLVLNASGGVWDMAWRKPGDGMSWNSKGVRVAGVAGFDDWTIEAAIPFADMGIQPGQTMTSWRGNFCRQDIPTRELTSWSPTGGGFQIPKRFGELIFTNTLQKQDQNSSTIRAEVRGILVESNGKPAKGVQIKTAIQMARTDASGAFVFKQISPGKTLFQIDSPRYSKQIGSVNVVAPQTIVEPIHLIRKDPYVPTWKIPFSTQTMTWWASSIDEPPVMSGKKCPLKPAVDLSMMAVPGQFESRAVVLLTSRKLVQPKAYIAKLVGPGGATIQSENLRVRWTQRLLKRIQYTRVREDAVLNWRFLWDESPQEIQSGNVRQLVLTVKVPDQTPAGIYRGRLVIESNPNGQSVSSLPIQLEVKRFKLAQPVKRVGCYYGVPGMPARQAEIEMKDIREHGGDLLIWAAPVRYRKQADGQIIYDLSLVRQMVLLQKKQGIKPPYTVYLTPLSLARQLGLKVKMSPGFAKQIQASKIFNDAFAGAIHAVDQLQKQIAPESFVYTWMDEVFIPERFELWKTFAQIVRKNSKTLIGISMNNRESVYLQQADPYLDIRNYHGHVLDWWLAQGHRWEELKSELAKSGDTAWAYYNIRDISVTSEYVRLCNGYWLWQSPIQAHVPWKYYSYGGSPFDDMDSDKHDFAYAAPHPTKPEMVSTLEWESFRAGYDDLRYLATLEQLLAKAAKVLPRSQSVLQAKALLLQLRASDPRVPALVEMLDGEAYNRRRIQLADAIEALLKTLRQASQ